MTNILKKKIYSLKKYQIILVNPFGYPKVTPVNLDVGNLERKKV